MGIDLVDIDRVGRMIARFGDRGLRRLLTPAERSYCQCKVRPEQHVAVRLAAKEAAYKALQDAGAARDVGWLEIEVAQDGDATVVRSSSSTVGPTRRSVAWVPSKPSFH